jgi:hypothetical protein
MRTPPTALWTSALPVAVLALLGAFAACNSGNIPIGQDNQPASCAKSTDCPSGEACSTALVCATACTTDAQCPQGDACVSGACEKSGCTTDADCPSGAVCVAHACVVQGPGCASDADCAAGDVCVNGQCLPQSTGCMVDADCPPNEICTNHACTAALHWFYTCGAPVCMGHTITSVTPCTTQQAGNPCTPSGQECDPGDSCDRLLVCASTDPTHGPGGCPISRARFKHDIRYLPDADLGRVRQDLMTMRLATWRYNHEGDAGREHLGFIIDDDPESPSVAADGNHVDLYGYTSMAVAAIQVQDREIAAQRRQIEALQRSVEALRDEVQACRGHQDPASASR